MKKTKVDCWRDFLLRVSLHKQKLEHTMHVRHGVPYSHLKFYSNACIKTGMILERLRQRKIKDGVGRLSLTNALKKATRATKDLREAISDENISE